MKIALLVLVSIGVALMAAAHFFTKATTVEDVVLLCTGGRHKASDFGLTGSISLTDIRVGTQLGTQFNKLPASSDSPERTRQQFQYLACVDKRRAEELAREHKSTSQNPCTKEEPCLEVLRVADFTQSGCLREGEASAIGVQTAPGRRDYAILEDTVTLTPPGLSTYLATAQPSGGASVEVYRTDGGNEILVPPAIVPASGSPYPIKHFTLPVKDGKVQYRWHWTNGHGADDNEGLILQSRYRVSSYHAKVLLPKGVQLQPAPVWPPEAAKACVVGHDSLTCSGLGPLVQNAMLKWLWTWNMWAQCPQQAAAGAALAPSGAKSQADSAATETAQTSQGTAEAPNSGGTASSPAAAAAARPAER